MKLIKRFSKSTEEELNSQRGQSYIRTCLLKLQIALISLYSFLREVFQALLFLHSKLEYFHHLQRRFNKCKTKFLCLSKWGKRGFSHVIQEKLLCIHKYIIYVCMLYVCVSCPSTPLEQFVIWISKSYDFSGWFLQMVSS